MHDVFLKMKNGFADQISVGNFGNQPHEKNEEPNFLLPNIINFFYSWHSMAKSRKMNMYVIPQNIYLSLLFVKMIKIWLNNIDSYFEQTYVKWT